MTDADVSPNLIDKACSWGIVGGIVGGQLGDNWGIVWVQLPMGDRWGQGILGKTCNRSKFFRLPRPLRLGGGGGIRNNTSGRRFDFCSCHAAQSESAVC